MYTYIAMFISLNVWIPSKFAKLIIHSLSQTLRHNYNSHAFLYQFIIHIFFMYGMLYTLNMYNIVLVIIINKHAANTRQEWKTLEFFRWKLNGKKIHAIVCRRSRLMTIWIDTLAMRFSNRVQQLYVVDFKFI